MPEARPENREATVQLRDIFEPLCVATAEDIRPEALTDSERKILREVSRTPIHTLPADLHFATMPWDAIRGQDLSSQAYPPDDRELQHEWLLRHPEFAVVEEGIFHHLRSTRALVGIRRLVFHGVDGKRRHPSEFDRGRWQPYEDYVASLPPKEQEQVEVHQDFRDRNIREATNVPVKGMVQADGILQLSNPTVAHEIIGNISIPVGEYGEEFAQDLLRATAITQGIVERRLPAHAAEVTEGNEDSLKLYTVRASEEGEASPKTTLMTVQESVQSTAQAIALLTMNKVEGFDNPHDLAKAVVDAGLVERLTKFGLGIVGPMALGGFHFPNAVVRDAQGNLDLSLQFTTYLEERKKNYLTVIANEIAKLAMLSENDRQIEENEGYKRLGTMCPVANRDGGLRILAVAYTKLAREQFAKEPIPRLSLRALLPRLRPTPTKRAN